ncbi:cytochrome d ubiquinol oxidase subunit II, partial [Klebsiella pneumoniae]|nr:cytochrome d ubiquinol oxidase subunit II [Klebsiella pneumoniae]
DLSIIWFVIIVFATLMYIVMDGFDLGIGILFPATPNADDRDVMVNSVAPVWDGNETWLVLGGAALFGAFPLAYAVIIDALTIPLTIMPIGLIFRGVAFEFRFKATPVHRPFWDKAFIGGSIVATFSQGITVGAVIHGFSVTGRAYSGGPFDWFTAFNFFCGAGLVVAYALLGSTWLVMKSENALQQR